MKLIIANKNYSSWSLRPWLLLKQLRIPFEEEKLSFNDPSFKARVRAVSPRGLVPVLVDGELAVWDSLAIVEYLAEKFPDRGVWPAAREARARARSVCAEMHSCFQALRSRLAMNCELDLPMPVLDLETRRDVDRICELWADCAHFSDGDGGPFLFGAFSAADAYFAPVVRRFLTYEIGLPEAARRYVATMDALPAMKEWVAAARAENDFCAFEEPYRERRPAPGEGEPAADADE
ncbi:MAG TPA: glutathione S-transferase family protein [Polyangia bacterium]|nr:glutathione S-transferase family protein [Polyangia bacterium]